ncbi:hypothetical protein Phou_094970 [Phytohabitans houttuyneae]|uniref:Uncharacterized protein n=1 Tax=Phytohabitans houttuyneae TaxID=1076126 RepID=A0A6V8KU21_9ACTN|nr:hypothetical protein Phou_094970 [Phytohabitans houttuyneae]
MIDTQDLRVGTAWRAFATSWARGSGPDAIVSRQSKRAAGRDFGTPPGVWIWMRAAATPVVVRTVAPAASPSAVGQLTQKSL